MNMQAELWIRLSSDTEDYGETFQTQKSEEISGIYEDMCGMFEATLNTEQACAFRGLICLSDDVKFYSVEEGMATGFLIAKGLQALTDDPADALKRASETYDPVRSAYMQALEDYFKTCEAAKGEDKRRAGA
jgi:hypothetical protein